jgi:hypothetical protein
MQSLPVGIDWKLVGKKSGPQASKTEMDIFWGGGTTKVIILTSYVSSIRVEEVDRWLSRDSRFMIFEN